MKVRLTHSSVCPMTLGSALNNSTIWSISSLPNTAKKIAVAASMMSITRPVANPRRIPRLCKATTAGSMAIENIHARNKMPISVASW